MQATMIVIGIVIILVGALIFMARARMKNIPSVEDHEKIITLSDSNFNNQVKNKIILVDFWASWCAPCRMMAPVLNDVAKELNGNMHVGKVNIEKYQSLANKYKVRSIPTIILLKNGKEVNRFVGFKNKDFLLKQIKAA